MFRLRHLSLDTLREHVIVIHEHAVKAGNLGFNPLDRAVVMGTDSAGQRREITGVLNFCLDDLIGADEIGLSDQAFRDIELPEGAAVEATLAVAPRSVERVRTKLDGERLDRAAFNAILSDVVQHRYSRVELAMFVLACALKRLDLDELCDYTQAMISTGESLDFGGAVVADKHSIGGIPGNRTTMIVVPIIASLGVLIPKTSSRAITSPAGTADTMGAIANVELSPKRMKEIVGRIGGCIGWGGALRLAPADDILITVERPMEIDTEAQMVASILAKKKSVGATHVVIDIPVGPTAKVRSQTAAQHLSGLFHSIADRVGLRVEVLITLALGPIGRGIGPRLEALDVRAVLGGDSAKLSDLREKSLYLAARLLEMTRTVSPNGGYRAAQQALDSGAALRKFNEIIALQGARDLPPEAPYKCEIPSRSDGRIRDIDCLEIARVAKRAGAPANLSAGVLLRKTVGEVTASGETLFEIHAASSAQLEFARQYATSHPEMFRYGF